MTNPPISSAINPANLNRGDILVIDDERAFCDVVCEILEAIGYQARYALNAAQALDHLSQFTPHLVLTDVMMPDMDGLSLVRHLRQQTAMGFDPDRHHQRESNPG